MSLIVTEDKPVIRPFSSIILSKTIRVFGNLKTPSQTTKIRGEGRFNKKKTRTGVFNYAHLFYFIAKKKQLRQFKTNRAILKFIVDCLLLIKSQALPTVGEVQVDCDKLPCVEVKNENKTVARRRLETKKT